MKIAVTTENGTVFQHFGKTKTFTLYTAQDGAITEKALLDAGEAGHSALATLLAENSVDVLICGGIGTGAKEALKSAGSSWSPELREMWTRRLKPFWKALCP